MKPTGRTEKKSKSRGIHKFKYNKRNKREKLLLKADMESKW